MLIFVCVFSILYSDETKNPSPTPLKSIYIIFGNFDIRRCRWQKVSRIGSGGAHLVMTRSQWLDLNDTFRMSVVKLSPNWRLFTSRPSEKKSTRKPNSIEWLKRRKRKTNRSKNKIYNHRLNKYDIISFWMI